MPNSGEAEFLVESQEQAVSKRRKQILVGAIAVIVSVSLIVILVMIFAVDPTQTKPKRNVILMISDGWGPASATLARAYSQKALNIDPYLVGTIRTFSANSLVTDSAAGATAYSCGKHTYNGGIGIDDSAKACGTVLEAASRKGLRTGVVSTTRVTDATPAAFCSHAADRSYEDYIAQQILDTVGFKKSMDVVLGGGRKFFSPSIRPDGLDLLTYAQEHGYHLALNSSAMEEVKSGKLLGLFADHNMAYVIDRENNPSINSTQPSLPVMAQKALDLLKNDNGFFVMLEGALIDVAEHANDAGSCVREVLGYDETFALALKFAKEHGNTVIISTSDHETGGLTVGLQLNYTPGAYPDYAYYPQLLHAFNASCDSMATRIIAGQDVAEVIASSTNITDITDEEKASILSYSPTLSGVSGEIGRIVSQRSLIGWTTHGHTGSDVNLYVYGLPDDFEFQGNQENIDVATLIAELLDLDLDAITKEVIDFPTNKPELNSATPEARDVYHHFH